ncbi:MAG: hypothetical protein IPM32_08725 [Ignavibacteriae bacterium]|nr:hypothetical protein [Ignavibacteriota bacterium]
MRPYSACSASETLTTAEERQIPQNDDQRSKEVGITSEEQILLHDIHSNKLSGVVERYQDYNGVEEKVMN